MAPRKKQKLAKTCCKSTRKPPPRKAKQGCMPPPRKPKDKVTKTTCPHCKGSGRIAKKKNKGGCFAYFFQHVCQRARESDVKQLRKITMKRASYCWNTLTQEQRDDFKMKHERGLGRPKSPGPGNRGRSSRKANHQDTAPSVSFNRDSLNRDSRHDLKSSASDCHVETTSSNDSKPEKRNDENDDTSKPLSPFGRFEYNPTGKYL